MTGKQVKKGTMPSSLGAVIPKDSRYCAVCGKNMVDPATGSAFIGMHIGIKIDPLATDTQSVLEFYKEQLGVYGYLLEENSPLSINICWECWLKSLGVKPK